MNRTYVTFALICFLICNHVLAQSDRPNEDALFGTPTTPKKTEANFTNSKDAEGLGAPNSQQDAFASGEVVDNPLQIGGLFYQRLAISARQNVGADDTPISLPLQFNIYLDVRPNDRIRGYVEERIFYDSTRDRFSNPTGGSVYAGGQNSSGATAPAGTFGSTISNTPNNPETALDQAWLKFDLNRTVFVTVGKQHLKWGASHYWNPTDFLNTQKRDPLLPYDLRLGSSMLKLALPLEEQKLNFYAITLFDNPTAASTLGQIGEALRIEKIIGPAEVGLDAVFRGHVTPTYGLDISLPFGPFDVYAEAAYLTGAKSPMYEVPASTLTSASDLETQFTSTTLSGPQIQTSGGLNYTFAWKENRQATVGGEYFYNSVGYTNSSAYPILLYKGEFQPFYTGRNYAALYLNAEGPDAQKHTSYTFSTLGNLSDNSYISRLDFAWRFLVYLTFNAYVAQHYGKSGGEFNFTIDTPAVRYLGNNLAAVYVPRTTTDFGMSLRLSF